MTGGASSKAIVDHSAELAELVGQRLGPPELARDPVNRPMIRHWVEAMGDANPIYTSDEAARAVGLEGVVAPPTMLQAWSMRGLAATLALEEARTRGGELARSGSLHDRLMALLDEEGRTSVVATNCEQHYERPLRPGERLVTCSVLESVSDPKKTALGVGRFVTTRLEFVAVKESEVAPTADPAALFEKGELVATQTFRILKFIPADHQGATTANAESPRRPRPALTQDNAFFFEGAREGRLLIQRCSSCGTLRHPPLPACGACRSLEWNVVESSGRGVVYSFVVVHHPKVPAFEYPLPIVLVELEEGTRLVANIDGVEPSEVRIGMAVVADFVAFDEDLTLPVFRPAA